MLDTPEDAQTRKIIIITIFFKDDGPATLAISWNW